MPPETLPADVYPDSRCRLPLVQKADLPPAALELFEDYTNPDGSSHAGLRGPGGVRMHSPKLAVTFKPTANYLRHETGLTSRIREVAILVAARENDCQFEWQQHEPIARREGVPEATIDAIKNHRSVSELDATDSLVIEMGRQLFRRRSLTSELFGRAQKEFGNQRLIDLLTILGNYAATALMLAAVDMHLWPGEEPLLPVD